MHKLALDPKTPNVLYLQDINGVYRSGDGGDSWQTIEEDLPSRFGFPLCVSEAGGLYVVPLNAQMRGCAIKQCGAPCI